MHGLSGERVIVEEHPAAAWHSGMAALLAPEFAAFHRAVAEGLTEESAAWSTALEPLMTLMGHERPLSVLYALAEVCGVRTGAPRRPLLPIPSRSRHALAEAVEQLRRNSPAAAL